MSRSSSMRYAHLERDAYKRSSSTIAAMRCDQDRHITPRQFPMVARLHIREFGLERRCLTRALSAFI